MSDNATELGQRLIQYCKTYAVPLEYVFEILNDQKVVPMIRGKATEYSAYLVLKTCLPSSEWSVEKLNLNAQPGTSDEDISVTHRRTGVILKVEAKNAVRGSMKSGVSTKKCKVPHFKVKCHRSRSNIKLAVTTNDRYSVDSFDLLICNVSNALFQGSSVDATLKLLDDKKVLAIVADYYGVKSGEELIKAAYEDWRFVFPSDIGEGGFIPRTPLVLLQNDPKWQPIKVLAEKLLYIVKARLDSKKTRVGRSR